MEIKRIKGYSLYTIDTNGNVIKDGYVDARGNKRKTLKLNVKLSKDSPTRKGGRYYRVNLIKDGVRVGRSLNRLLWETFIGDVPEGYEIVNKVFPEKPTLKDLVCVSRDEFTKSVQNLKVTVVNPEGELVTADTMQALCKEYDLNWSSMSFVVTGKTKQHKGWTRYEDTQI